MYVLNVLKVDSCKKKTNENDEFKSFINNKLSIRTIFL